MKYIVLSVVLMTILTGCGNFEWFPSQKNPTSVSVSTSTLADAPTDLTYSQALTATGGTGTYTWTVASGTLPTGLTLSTGGTISGTPTAVTTATAGTDLYVFTVKASDSASTPSTATRSLSIFTPTTGRMNDATGKVFAAGLTFDTTQGLAVPVTNTDTVVHTVQVVVANYDATGKIITGNGSPFNMTPVTVAAGTTITATNTLFDTFPVNNWRIRSVSIQ